jgi:hypothetical protein
MRTKFDINVFIIIAASYTTQWLLINNGSADTLTSSKEYVSKKTIDFCFGFAEKRNHCQNAFNEDKYAIHAESYVGNISKSFYIDLLSWKGCR